MPGRVVSLLEQVRRRGHPGRRWRDHAHPHCWRRGLLPQRGCWRGGRRRSRARWRGRRRHESGTCRRVRQAPGVVTSDSLAVLKPGPLGNAGKSTPYAATTYDTEAIPQRSHDMNRRGGVGRGGRERGRGGRGMGNGAGGASKCAPGARGGERDGDGGETRGLGG